MTGREPQRLSLSIPPGKTWQVGIVGYHSTSGLGGHGLELAFLGLPNVRITAVVDPDKEGREFLKKKTNTKKGYSSISELLEEQRPDIVCACSRLPSKRKDVIIESIRAGCHVYSEKPFAENLEDADTIIEEARKRNIKIAVAHLGRYAPMYRRAKEMIQEGIIGKVLSVYCRGKEDHRGGGEDMMVLGTHLFDMCNFFFGRPSWVSGYITANGKEITQDDVHKPTEDVGPVAGDHITATFGYPNGIRGFFESRRGISCGKKSRMGILVVGSEGLISLKFDGKPRLYISRGKYTPEEPKDFESIWTNSILEVSGTEPIILSEDSPELDFPFAYCNRYAAVDLIWSIAEDRSPISCAEDARWALEIIFGIYSSHLSGKRINLPLKDRQHPLIKKGFS